MKKSYGFTLIELLVVIAIIALLLSIIMPGLNLAKKRAASAACLSGAKQLTLAWYMYTEDNDGKLISPGTGTGSSDWVHRPLDENYDPVPGGILNALVNEEDERRGIEKGALFEYVETADVYHCPADKRKDALQPQTDGAWRTYSISACMGVSIKQMAQMTSPGSRVAFVEEADMRQWNNGAWSFYAYRDPIDWWDPMAVNHGDSSILGFADGHAGRNTWRDPWTKERIEYIIEKGLTNYSEVPASPAEQRTDIEYMGRGWAY